MGLSSMHASRPDRRDRLLLISALAIAVTAGRARECSRRSRLTAHARRRAFARHPPGGRTNMLSKGALNSLPARSRQRNRQPAASVPLHQRPPTAALHPSVHRPSSSFPFHRLLVISSCLVLSGRPAAGTSVTPVRFDRHLSGGRTCCPTAAQLAACAQRAAEPIAGCLGTASPTTADRGSSPFRPSSVLLFPVSPSSRYFLLSGPVRPAGGRYLSDAGFVSIGTCRGSEQHAAQPRLNSLPARSGQRNRQPAASVALHQRPPTAALHPSVHRPSSSLPFHRLLVVSSFVVLSGRPAAGTSVTPARFDRHLSGGRTTCCPTAAQRRRAVRQRLHLPGGGGGRRRQGGAQRAGDGRGAVRVHGDAAPSRRAVDGRRGPHEFMSDLAKEFAYRVVMTGKEELLRSAR